MYTTYERPVIFLRTIWISLIVGRKLVKNARICKLNNQTQELKNSIIASQFDEVCIKQLNYKMFVPVKNPFFRIRQKISYSRSFQINERNLKNEMFRSLFKYIQ